MDRMLLVRQCPGRNVYPYVKFYLPVFIFILAFIQYHAWAWNARVSVPVKPARYRRTYLFRVCADSAAWIKSLSDGYAAQPDFNLRTVGMDLMEKEAAVTEASFRSIF